MLMRKSFLWATLFAAAGGIVLVSVKSQDAIARHRGRTNRYEVTLTNLTRGQIFSPGVLVTHTRDMEPLFVAGSPASDELAAVAEDAIADPLVAALGDSDDVRGIAMITGEIGPILPGESATVVVETTRRDRRFSLVGTPVTTNDAFYALNGIKGPSSGSSTHDLRAYDAGTEANNELCSHIPGPPCGNAEIRATEEAEGYVHIHAGVHGGGDLDPAVHDWRNPVGRLTIRRIR